MSKLIMEDVSEKRRAAGRARRLAHPLMNDLCGALATTGWWSSSCVGDGRAGH